MEPVFNPGPWGLLAALGIAAWAMVGWRLRIDPGIIGLGVMIPLTAFSTIAALINHDGSYVPWTGMNLVLLGLAFGAHFLPSEEY